MSYDESNSRLMLIDDRDPAVRYGATGNWEEDITFGYTVTYTTNPSDSLAFEFDGTRIIVSVLLKPNITVAPVSFTYTINDTDTVSDTIVAEPVEEWAFWKLLDKQGLPDGSHWLNLTVVQASKENPFVLDGFMFRPSKRFWDLAIAAPSDLNTASNNTNTTGTADNSTGNNSTVSGTPARASGSKGGPPVGPIVGGIVGGVLLVALALVGGYIWWRRQRVHLYSSLPDERSTTETRVTPFTDAAPSSTLSPDISNSNFIGTHVPSTININTQYARGYADSAPMSAVLYAPSVISHVGATVGPDDSDSDSNHDHDHDSDHDVRSIHSESNIGAGSGKHGGYQLQSAAHLRSVHGVVGTGMDVSAPLATESPPPPPPVTRPEEEVRPQEREGALPVAGEERVGEQTRRHGSIAPEDAPPEYTER